MRNPDPPTLDGFLAIDKPEGPTSHDVVAAVRRALGVRRIGHTGTLDPFASGLLLLLTGRATRLADLLHGLPKTYHARLRLGEATDTDDRTGRVIASSPDWSSVSEAQIRAAFASQTGEHSQQPPAFSAKKIAGRRAYHAARRGETVELEAATVRIDELRVITIELPFVEFEVTCGPGTYIRAIARDIGFELKVFGHLVALRRTRIGPFGVQEALPLSQLDAHSARSELRPPIECLPHIPRVRLDAALVSRLAHGMRVAHDAPVQAGVVAVLDGGGLIAIAEAGDGWITPRKVFVDA